MPTVAKCCLKLQKHTLGTNTQITSCHRGFIRKELPENDEKPVVVNNQTDDSGIPVVELDSPGTVETAGHGRPSAGAFLLVG